MIPVPSLSYTQTLLERLKSSSAEEFQKCSEEISKLSWKEEVIDSLPNSETKIKDIARSIWSMKDKCSEEKQGLVIGLKDIALQKMACTSRAGLVAIARAFDDLSGFYSSEDKFEEDIQELSNKLMRKISDEFAKLSDREMAWTVFSFRKLKKPEEAIYLKVASLSLGRIKQFDAKVIGLMAKGFTQHAIATGNQYPILFEHINESIEGKTFAGLDISSTVWGYAYAQKNPTAPKAIWKPEHQERAKKFNNTFLNLFAEKMVTANNLNELSGGELVRIVWSLKQFSDPSPKVFEPLCQSLSAKFHLLSEIELATAINNLIKSGKNEVLTPLFKQISQKLRSFDAGTKLSLTHSLLIAFCHKADKELEDLIKQLWAEVAQVSHDTWSDIQLSMLNIVYHACLKIVKIPEISLPKELEIKIQTYLSSIRHEPSSLHEKIYEQLIDAPGFLKEFSFTNEVSFLSYSIDIAHVDKEKKIAIEIDGIDYHCYRNSTTPLHKEILRDALLRVYGWQVFHIPSDEWRRERDKKAYLARKLAPLNPIPVEPLRVEPVRVESVRLEGTIKFFDREKGFGFIIPSNGDAEIYLHKSQLPTDDPLNLTNIKVEYEIGPRRDQKARPEAQKVKFKKNIPLVNEKSKASLYRPRGGKR